MVGLPYGGMFCAICLNENQNQKLPGNNFHTSCHLHDTQSSMRPNDLWSLYAHAVVRFDYYASVEYSESHRVANFERDGISLYAEMLMEHV